MLSCYPLVLHTPCQMSMVGGKIFYLTISTTYAWPTFLRNGWSTISCTMFAQKLGEVTITPTISTTYTSTIYCTRSTGYCTDDLGGFGAQIIHANKQTTNRYLNPTLFNFPNDLRSYLCARLLCSCFLCSSLYKKKII